MPILRTHEVLGIVDGSEPCPPKFLPDSTNPNTVNPAYAVWQKKDQLVLSWILCSLSPAILTSLGHILPVDTQINHDPEYLT